MTVLVTGESLVDCVDDGSGPVQVHVGGGPLNTAMALGRLEVPVAFAGRISTDEHGELIARALVSSGVDTSFVHRTAAPTMVAHATISGGSAQYRFEVEGTAARGLRPAELHVGHDVDALHTGTLGLVLEPMASTIAAAIAQLPPRVVLSIDPNVRTSLITDAAAYRARLDAVLARADIVKVSDDDVAWLAPELDPVAWATQLAARGVALVVATHGARGATAVRRGARPVWFPAIPTEVVDTIGAGDAFAAGMLAGLWRCASLTRERLAGLDEATLASVIDLASVVAARTVARAGADTPRANEL